MLLSEIKLKNYDAQKIKTAMENSAYEKNKMKIINSFLSSLDLKNSTKEFMEKIVFENIQDEMTPSDIILVFGNYELMKERVQKAFSLYQNKTAPKIIFSGGANGISNFTNEPLSEAEIMMKFALKLGIPKEDILIEKHSQNSIENVQNSMKIIEQTLGKINSITLVSSEFHIKRCKLIFQKYAPSQIKCYTAIATDYKYDKSCYHTSEAGRKMIECEAKLLVYYAKNHIINDTNI